MTTTYPSKESWYREKENIKFTKYKDFKGRVNITFV